MTHDLAIACSIIVVLLIMLTGMFALVDEFSERERKARRNGQYPWGRQKSVDEHADEIFNMITPE